MAETLLTVEDLSLYYGAVQALHSLSLDVRHGEIVTLLGANGAGKSSTLRAISRLHPSQCAQMTFDGLDIRGALAHRLAGRGLIHAPEGRGIFTRLTVRENLILGSWSRHEKPRPAELTHIFELFPILRARIDQSASTLSGGEQQMLAIARALLGRPKLLLLDEPSLGLAPKVVDTIFETLSRINAEGVSILLVEQNAARALHIAHRGYVLESGSLVASGTGAELLHSPEIRKAYLG